MNPMYITFAIYLLLQSFLSGLPPIFLRAISTIIFWAGAA